MSPAITKPVYCILYCIALINKGLHHLKYFPSVFQGLFENESNKETSFTLTKHGVLAAQMFLRCWK